MHLIRIVAAALALTGTLVLVGPTNPAAAQEPEADGDTHQILAERYAPHFALGARDEPCAQGGEPYSPIAVDAVLNNDQILLRQIGNANPVVMRGPGPQDLHDLGEGFFLDFPGSSLAPGCIYDKDNERYTEGLPATVYAHVIELPDEGQVVLQYWFYWYYNDWNNTHESDWEGISLRFDAPTAEAALALEPAEVGFSQHEGGERADWDSEKLRRVDTHPVVYSSHGSHASYFESATFLGRSAGEGFGCDDTTDNTREVRPQVVVLPDSSSGPDDPLAWIDYGGRWGERQSGPFNGPTGPASKERWVDPLPWFDDLRDSAVAVPVGPFAATSVIDSFCSIVEAGSRLSVSVTTSPARTLAVLALAGLLLWFVLDRTEWSAVPTAPIVARRRAGQILRAAGRIYRNDVGGYATIGLVYLASLPVALLMFAIALWLPVIGPLLELTGDRSPAGVVFSVFLALFPNLIAYLIVNAAVAGRLRDDPAAERGPLAAYVVVAQTWRPLAHATARATVIVVGLCSTVIGIPWGIRQLIRYQFATQAIMIEDTSGRQSLDRSTQLVRGRLGHTGLVLALINGAVALTGLLAGLVLLLVVSRFPLWGFMVLQTLTSAALVPLAAIAVTLLYGDAAAEETGMVLDPAGARDLVES